MKLIRKDETEQKQNSETCVCREYDFNDHDIDLGICEIKGRYPNNGTCHNLKSKELVYVLEGNGIININEEEIEFFEKDSFLIEPMERYFFKGNCKLALICNPAWKQENHVYENGEV